MMLVNGKYQTHIEVTDRGFQYGDGLFETITVHDGKAVFLIQHLDRLTTA
ncbi:MAG: 4-amino-4-deoxychorismate lyase, partial [Methylococcaceae bacterium NSP1-2]